MGNALFKAAALHKEDFLASPAFPLLVGGHKGCAAYITGKLGFLRLHIEAYCLDIFIRRERCVFLSFVSDTVQVNFRCDKLVFKQFGFA